MEGSDLGVLLAATELHDCVAMEEAIEHFHTKLLKLAEGFTTCEGARLAAQRHGRLQVFLDGFMDEIGVTAAPEH